MKRQIILTAVSAVLGYFFYIYGHGWERVGLWCILGSLIGIIVCIGELIEKEKRR